MEKARAHFEEVVKIKPKYPFIAWAKLQLGYNNKDLPHLRRLFEPLCTMYGEAPKAKRYVHTGVPAFEFEYPEDSRKLSVVSPNQVLRMRTPRWVEIQASVADIPEAMTLADIGPKVYLPTLKEVGSNFNVVSNDEITLKDGTKAYRTEIKGLYRDGKTQITTLLVSAFKDGKWVYLTTDPIGDPSEVAWIVESLTFE